jgi:hypothetical protein
VVVQAEHIRQQSQAMADRVVVELHLFRGFLQAVLDMIIQIQHNRGIQVVEQDSREVMRAEVEVELASRVRMLLVLLTRAKADMAETD